MENENSKENVSTNTNTVCRNCGSVHGLMCWGHRGKRCLFIFVPVLILIGLVVVFAAGFVLGLKMSGEFGGFSNHGDRGQRVMRGYPGSSRQYNMMGNENNGTGQGMMQPYNQNGAQQPTAVPQ